jgi:hypothetical protein
LASPGPKTFTENGKTKKPAKNVGAIRTRQKFRLEAISQNKNQGYRLTETPLLRKICLVLPASLIIKRDVVATAIESYSRSA